MSHSLQQCILPRSLPLRICGVSLLIDANRDGLPNAKLRKTPDAYAHAWNKIRQKQTALITVTAAVTPYLAHSVQLIAKAVAGYTGPPRGGFKAESLLGHITRKASSPLPSPPSPSLSSPSLFPPLRSLRSRPLKFS